MIPTTWLFPVNFTLTNYTSKLNFEKKKFSIPERRFKFGLKIGKRPFWDVGRNFFLWKKKCIIMFFEVKFTGDYRDVAIISSLFRDHSQNSKKPNFSLLCWIFSVQFFVSTFRRVEFFMTTFRRVKFLVSTFRRVRLISVQFEFTVFGVELFGVELPACTVVRCRVFVQSYLRVELVGVESDHHRNDPRQEVTQGVKWPKAGSGPRQEVAQGRKWPKEGYLPLIADPRNNFFVQSIAKHSTSPK